MQLPASLTAAAPPLVLLCGTGDLEIITGLAKVAQSCAGAGRSVRLYVSDDDTEQARAILASVPWIIWDGHGWRWPRPKVGGRFLDEVLSRGGQPITAEAFMLGCCFGATTEFTDVISRHLAGPTAFLGCEYTPDRTHGPLIWPPVIDELAPLIGRGAAPQELAAAMNAGAARAVRAHPELKDAHWKATVLHPAHA